MESKAGERDRDDDGWSRTRKAQAGHQTHCPSVLDVASFESGDLSEFRRAAVNDHSRRCFRCGCSLAELRQARDEILGVTAGARTMRSRRAAEEIQNLLRRRLH